MTQPRGRFLRWFVLMAFAAALVAGAVRYRDRWLALLRPAEATAAIEPLGESQKEKPAANDKIVVSEQAQLNLGLAAKPLRPQTYWKVIQVPGMVVDRPGQSDRGVVATATGVISNVYHFPGDTVQPGDPLFTLKLLSESLHLTQSELFKATQNIMLSQTQRKLLASVPGAIPEARVIEVDNQITRLEIAVKAYRQELQNRGFGSELIDGITHGKFVNELTVIVPPMQPPISSDAPQVPETSASLAPVFNSPPTYEVQELSVELGQQVHAGQTLCIVANHQKLAIEGRAFRDETPLLERSVTKGWPVEVDFQEETEDWGAIQQSFRIRHMANTINPVNRTFAFRMPVENQSRVIDDEGRTQTLWRFRPGQKVKILVRVEKLDSVFVLPADAVASDGPEAFVFTQNVNTFERKSVRILLHDRQKVVLANDGTLLPGTYVVQSAAEQLNRMVKSGESSGVPKGFHIHADGSLHKNEEEGK